jgi:hypothetical protein
LDSFLFSGAIFTTVIEVEKLVLSQVVAIKELLSSVSTKQLTKAGMRLAIHSLNEWLDERVDGDQRNKDSC